MNTASKNRFSIMLLVILSLALVTVFSFTDKRKDNLKAFKASKRVKYSNYLKPLTFSANLDNKYYFNSRDIYLNLEIKAEDIQVSADRTPLNISIVIDKSGSMSSKNKLDYVKKAVEYIIDDLNTDDYVSIVTYDDYVSTVYASSKVEDKDRLKDEVRKIIAGGFTNLSGGMNQGFEQVERTYKRGYVNRVMLLSDGLANRGITDRLKLNKIVKDKCTINGITISTFGVGNDFNENLMADLSTYGNGNYYYIKNSIDIPEIFTGELNSVKILVAQNTKIKVKYPSDYLSVSNVFGYNYELSGENIYIDLKDVFSGQKKTVLIKFTVKRNIDSRQQFENSLTYEDARNDLNKVEEVANTEIIPASTISEYDSGINLPVRQYAVKQEANAMMEQAFDCVDNGDYKGARDRIDKSKEYMNGQFSAMPVTPEMQEQYDNLDKYGKDLENVESKTADEKKEMQKSGKYQNYETRKK